MRFNPLVQALTDLVRGGGLGQPRSLHASFGFVAPADPAHRLWDPALGGGALLDLGVYTVDLARLLLGEVAQVAVTGSRAATGVDAEQTLHLVHAGGAHALLDTSLVARLPGTARLVGSAGWAELSPSFHAPTRLTVQEAGRDVVEHEIPDRTAGFVGELEEVARCVAAGRGESEVLPLDETVATMRVLDRARELMAAGRG